jgi:hypothetical protein
MVQPFSDAKIEIRFYGHTPPLNPVIDFGIKNSLFLINDLFGVCRLSKKEILELENNGNIVILDASHSILNVSRLKISAQNVYIIASLRKVFPLCDGGIVYSSDPSFNPDLSDPAGWEPMLEAMFLKKYYLNNRMAPDSYHVKEHYRHLYDNYSENKGLPLTKTEKIPDISLVTLKNLHFSAIKKKRQKNLEHIYANLAKNNQLFPLKSITSPFVAPILFKDNDRRNNYRKVLISRNVFPTVHWDIPSEVPQRFTFERLISGRLLSIPIDQRYNPESYGEIFTLLPKK